MSPIVSTWNRAVAGMAFTIIVRDRATQDIRRQANYILAMWNRDAAESLL
jgi:plasmid stabilization system protein ParE